MKLRTRLILLIVASAVIPPLMVLIAAAAGYSRSAPISGAQGFFFAQRVIHGDFDDLPTIQEAEAILLESGPIAGIFVLDADGVIRYPSSREGEAASVDTLLRPVEEPRLSTVVPLLDDRGGSGFVVAINPSRPIPDRIALVGLTVPIVFVLITSIGSSLIIRSINNSTRKLEEATGRIAEGDLDFELEPTSGRDRIASLTRSFDRMRLQLKEQLDRGSRFLMGISHDLKTPLASISGYVDAITDGYADDQEKLDRYMGIIRTKTELLESRISALIDYAKQETREWKASLEQVRLRSFLDELASIVGVEAQARGFEFVSTIDIPESMDVLMDADMVTRALENLAENAFSYAEPRTTIRLDARAIGVLASDDRSRSRQVKIAIENRGPGIGPDDLPHIFDPLYRASASRQGKGFGLGLSIVKSVITSHGWEIDVDSTPGATTTFSILVPVPAQ